MKYLKLFLSLAFGLTMLPMNFLVDRNAMIISRNIHGAELRKLLEELLPE